jgi:hypothetical protein
VFADFVRNVVGIDNGPRVDAECNQFLEHPSITVVVRCCGALCLRFPVAGLYSTSFLECKGPGGRNRATHPDPDMQRTSPAEFELRPVQIRCLAR